MLENQLRLFDQLIREKRFVELKLLVAYLKDEQTRSELQKQQAIENSKLKPLDTLIKSLPEERQRSLSVLSELVARHGHALSERESYS
jgi:hypothetical protein